MTSKIYEVRLDDGSDFEVVARTNTEARKKAVDYMRFYLGYMSQDVKPKFSCKEKKDYTDASLAGAQARLRRSAYKGGRW